MKTIFSGIDNLTEMDESPTHDTLYRELLVGCGSRHRDAKIIAPDGDPKWKNLTRADINTNHEPDIILDLCQFPFELNDNTFDEIHAYEVLEHTGRQGDVQFFFKQFSEFHRILRPGGLLCATVPSWKSQWAWGDPSHTRIITAGTLVFLSQKEYQAQVGVTAMSDFRYFWKRDFDIAFVNEDQETLAFILRAVK